MPASLSATPSGSGRVGPLRSLLRPKSGRSNIHPAETPPGPSRSAPTPARPGPPTGTPLALSPAPVAPATPTVAPRDGSGGVDPPSPPPPTQLPHADKLAATPGAKHAASETDPH